MCVGFRGHEQLDDLVGGEDARHYSGRGHFTFSVIVYTFVHKYDIQ